MCAAATGPEPVSSAVPAPEAELTTELYSVPSHAAWFAYDTVHTVEQQSVPEFFTGKSTSKTPAVSRSASVIVRVAIVSMV